VIVHPSGYAAGRELTVARLWFEIAVGHDDGLRWDAKRRQSGGDNATAGIQDVRTRCALNTDEIAARPVRGGGAVRGLGNR
jgi:hypothetical protein